MGAFVTDSFPRLDLKRIEFRVLPMRTRFPFKYGIASLTALPHLVLNVEAEIDGARAEGIASEGLPPKWFTKNPDTTFEQDLPAMLEVIGHAAELALSAPPSSFFELWFKINEAQSAWASETGHPPLLANLGVSLMERALLDALCRHLGSGLHAVLRENQLGLRLGEVRPELSGTDPVSFLPERPLSSIRARHTIGLGDPLTAVDVTDENKAEDNLPLDLESCIRTYGLTHFKIKVCGNLEIDLPRLEALSELLGPEALFTLDGNEQYSSINAFREHWEAWREKEKIRVLLDTGLLLIEQPAHRDESFASSVSSEFAAWPDRPAFIIDEADGAIDSLPQALALGYDGVSHKNCKGMVKGLANAATLAEGGRNRERAVHLSGEDLANVGPIALFQDLAMMAALGIEHVERNGHHYFKGLSAWPESVQASMLENHDDLYRAHPEGYPTLGIKDGMLELSSLNAAPFGPSELLDVSALERVDPTDSEGFIRSGMPTG
jgi:L-alanine-DL-glutamate epimerase-like enolase superfamily enzyme